MSAAPGDLRDDEGDIEPEMADVSPPAAARWSVQMTRLDLPIYSLHRRFREHELIIDPDFARDLRWNTSTKSRLVESVLVRIPLPAFYFVEDLSGKVTVIDGQQRLDALFSFIENRFSLENLPLLWDLDGKSFTSIERGLQRRFLDTPLTCFVVQPGTSPELTFEIFRRVNTGAQPLSSQEVRNSVFRGPGLDVVKRLANDTGPFSFRAVAGQHRTFPGMYAEELVLRGLAFLDRGRTKYRGRMETFLSEELIRLNNATPEHLARLSRRMRTALERVAAVFGENAFRRYIPAGDRWAASLSGPLVEVMVTGFDHYFPEGKPLESTTALAIRERFKRLCADPTFVGAITGATQSAASVEQRFSRWMKELACVA